jgi:hypothetical protein
MMDLYEVWRSWDQTAVNEINLLVKSKLQAHGQ